MRMNVTGFSSEDSDYYYIDSVRAHVLSKDDDPDITLHRKETEIVGHIRPSRQETKQEIIDNLLHLHRSMHLRVIFSKSLGISRTISYTIPL